MATVLRQLKARLTSCRVVLGDIDGTARHQAVSRLQCDAFLSLMKTATKDTLGGTAKSDLCDMALACKWHGTDGEDTVNALAEMVKPEPERILGQDYCAFTCYLVNAIWDTLLDSAVDCNGKIRTLISYLSVRLGLRSCSEQTLKMIVAVVLATTLDKSSVHSLDHSSTIAFRIHAHRVQAVCSGEAQAARNLQEAARAP